MFSVYHTRDQKHGTAYLGRDGQPAYIRWECGFIEPYREGGFVRRID